MLVSLEGHAVYTHRSIICLHSSILRQLVTTLTMNTSSMVVVSVPVRANTLAMLVKVLTTGVTQSNDKDELLDVIEAAEIIGIYLYRYELNDRGLAKSNFYNGKESVKEEKAETKPHDKSETKFAMKKRGRPIGSTAKIIPSTCTKCDET